MSAKKFQKSLKNLSEIDSEFAEFLKKEDGSLLDFEISDDDDEDDDNLVGDNGDEETKLIVASDEDTSTDEDKDEKVADQKKKKLVKSGQTLVTLKMVKKWNQLLQTNIHEGLKEVTSAFNAAITFSTSAREENNLNKYVVEGVNVYSAVLNLCLVELVPTLLNHLSLPSPPSASLSSSLPQKLVLPSHSKNWKKIKLLVKPYLADVLKLVKHIKSSEDSLLLLMKHVYQLVSFYICYPKLLKEFVKQLIDLWSSSEESIRITSFRCLVRMMANLNEKQTKFIFTNLYLSCMQNCRFTNATSLPSINFMKQSLVELYCLKVDVAYHCCFIFVQQMARHVHNALKLQKKDTLQAINNWQFCHSLSIWAQLIGQKKEDKYLKSVLHPLIEIILGTVRLNHSPSYIPLRLFCARVLTHLSEQTGVYIPVLPIIIEPLELQLFKSNPKQANMKSCVFACCLRMNKHELKEKAFLDACLDEIFELLLSYFSLYSHTIGFPELVLPALVQLKKFLKSSRAQNYVKKLKQVVDKIQSTSENIQKKRRLASIDIRNESSLNSFEEQLKETPSDIKKFYDGWMKIRIKQLELQASKKDQICLDKLPEIKRPPIQKKSKEQKLDDAKKITSLFKISGQVDNDDDEEDEDEEEDDIERFKLKEERNSTKTSLKRKRQNEDDEEDDDEDDEEDDYSDDDEDASDDEDGDDDKRENKKMKIMKTKANGHADNGDDDEERNDDDDDDDQPDIVEDFKFDDNDDSNDDDDDDDDET